MQKLHSNSGYISDPIIKSKIWSLGYFTKFRIYASSQISNFQKLLVFKVNLNIDKILHLSMSFFIDNKVKKKSLKMHLIKQILPNLWSHTQLVNQIPRVLNSCVEEKQLIPSSERRIPEKNLETSLL